MYSLWLTLMHIYAHISIFCDPKNHSTYIIPNADFCLNNGYYFKNMTKCMHAKGRDKYCEGGDSHFCGIRTKGLYKDYYQVECG